MNRTRSYEVPVIQGKTRTLTLDARIPFDAIKDPISKERVREWAMQVAELLLLPHNVHEQIKGVVFEVRQGYKSKDSKRQNADISNAVSAYANLYIPVMALFSTQIDKDVALRYVQARWLLLQGTMNGMSTNSTYVFCREVLDYDLAGFFHIYSNRIKSELEKILSTLLEA